MMIFRRAAYFTDFEMIEYYPKKEGWNNKSTKTKNHETYQIHYAKKSFFTVFVGMYECYENIKIKLRSTISILKPWDCRNF